MDFLPLSFSPSLSRLLFSVFSLTLGYVYASAGFGESSTDLLYAGCAIIAENGRKLAENNRFSLQSQLITSEIDIQLLEHDRQKNSAFNSGLNTLPFNSINFRHIPFSTPQLKELTLSRSIATQPFVPQGEELDLRCQEIINIQATALAVRLSHTHINSVLLGISGPILIGVTFLAFTVPL